MAIHLAPVLRIGIALACMLPFALHAEDLPDPTRPPAVLTAGVLPAGATPPEPAKPAGLQSVLISPHRKAAVINGQTIELGGKYGDFRLIAIGEAGVVLEGAKGRREMSLFPGVRKAVISRRAAP